MKTRSERATEKFMAGYNCAQSVLWAFADDVGLNPETALKIACGFGAGIGRKQETCGAVSGAIMALGLRHGRGEAQDRSATEATYAKTRELLARFEARLGSCNCRQLLGCDLATDQGHADFLARDLRGKVCAPCVQAAVSILEEMGIVAGT